MVEAFICHVHWPLLPGEMSGRRASQKNSPFEASKVDQFPSFFPRMASVGMGKGEKGEDSLEKKAARNLHVLS